MFAIIAVGKLSCKRINKGKYIHIWKHIHRPIFLEFFEKLNFDSVKK